MLNTFVGHITKIENVFKTLINQVFFGKTPVLIKTNETDGKPIYIFNFIQQKINQVFFVKTLVLNKTNETEGKNKRIYEFILNCSHIFVEKHRQ